MKIYKAAIYLRLSREESDKENQELRESNSISNQRDLIMYFINNRNDIEFVDEYTDDGVSGFDFDRPRFDDMVADVKSGIVDCVIVKDVSYL